jgi:hypothetical protein
VRLGDELDGLTPVWCRRPRINTRRKSVTIQSETLPSCPLPATQHQPRRRVVEDAALYLSEKRFRRVVWRPRNIFTYIFAAIFSPILSFNSLHLQTCPQYNFSAPCSTKLCSAHFLLAVTEIPIQKGGTPLLKVMGTPGGVLCSTVSCRSPRLAAIEACTLLARRDPSDHQTAIILQRRVSAAAARSLHRPRRRRRTQPPQR